MKLACLEAAAERPSPRVPTPRLPRAQRRLVVEFLREEVERGRHLLDRLEARDAYGGDRWRVEALDAVRADLLETLERTMPMKRGETVEAYAARLVRHAERLRARLE